MAASSHISRTDFEEVFASLVEDVSQAAKQYNIPAPALEWFQKVLSLKTIKRT
jgi:farnesyl diphosphate synthase